MIVVAACSCCWFFAAKILHLPSNVWEGQAMHVSQYYNLSLVEKIKPLWVHTFSHDNHWDTKHPLWLEPLWFRHVSCGRAGLATTLSQRVNPWGTKLPIPSLSTICWTLSGCGLTTPHSQVPEPRFELPLPYCQSYWILGLQSHQSQTQCQNTICGLTTPHSQVPEPRFELPLPYCQSYWILGLQSHQSHKQVLAKTKQHGSGLPNSLFHYHVPSINSHGVMHLFIGRLRSWQLIYAGGQWTTTRFCGLLSQSLSSKYIKFRVVKFMVTTVGTWKRYFGVKASSALCGGKFNPAIVFALKLLLMQHEKIHVPDIIKYDGVMVATPKLHHLGRKHLRVPHLELKRVLEQAFLQTPSFLTQKRPSEWGVGTSEGLMWSWTARRSQQVLQEMVDTKKHCSGCVSQPPPIPPVPPAPPSMPCRHPNCASAPAPLPGQHKCSAHKQHRPACNASTGNQPISQAPCSWRCPRKLPKPAYSCPQRSPHWTHLSKCPSCSQRHRRSLCRCSAAGFFCPCPRWGSHWSWH